jgi:hypothetical protein
MKYVAVLAALVAAFLVGRNTVPEFVHPPSIAIGIVQATEPVAVTIEVTLTPSKASPDDSANLHQLAGTAVYQFTNLTSEPVKLAFPPVRTIGISENQISNESSPCPEGLATAETIVIPPHGNITRSGPWASMVSGDLTDA